MNRGHKYDHRKQSREELLDDGGVLSDSEIYILYRMYDKLEKLESKLIEAKAKKETTEVEKLMGDNIYNILIYFDRLYKVMNDVEYK